MVLLEVEEIARGDYSEEYGTVDSVVEEGDTIIITFMNGQVFSAPKGTQMDIDQGGRFSHNGNRRPDETTSTKHGGS